MMTSEAASVELPANQQVESHLEAETDTSVPETPTAGTVQSAETSRGPDTPSTQTLPSDDKSTASQNTPSTYSAQTDSTPTATPSKATKPASRAAVPAVPVVPAVPKAGAKDTKSPTTSQETSLEQRQTAPTGTSDKATGASDASVDKPGSEVKPEPAPAPVKAPPKLWTGLFAKTPSTSTPTASTQAASSTVGSTNGASAEGATGALTGASFAKVNASSLAEALRAYRVGGGYKTAFLEPRGLINTGNMCYMNSVSPSSILLAAYNVNG